MEKPKVDVVLLLNDWQGRHELRTSLTAEQISANMDALAVAGQELRKRAALAPIPPGTVVRYFDPIDDTWEYGVTSAVACDRAPTDQPVVSAYWRGSRVVGWMPRYRVEIA